VYLRHRPVTVKKQAQSRTSPADVYQVVLLYLPVNSGNGALLTANSVDRNFHLHGINIITTLGYDYIGHASDCQISIADPMPVPLGYVVGKMTMGQDFLRVLMFSSEPSGRTV